MPIAGFSFTKISAQRTEGKGDKINIENNVAIKNIEEIDLSIGKSGQKTLKFTFEFTSIFTPGYGTIALNGEIIYVDEEKVVKEVLKEWKKDKKVKQDIFPTVLNGILHKCNIEALLLSREISLPSPIPLPKVNVQ